MPSELSHPNSTFLKGQRNQDRNLQMNLRMVDYFIRRNYLSQLSSSPVVAFPTPDSTKNLRIFHVSKIIYDENEEINEKLTSVYSALQSLHVAVYVLIVGCITGADFYLGVRSNESAGIPADVLRQSFESHFPGSDVDSAIRDSALNMILDKVNFDNISCVTAVPAPREDNEKKFIQGIEKLIDAMQGKEYSVLLVANPVTRDDLDSRRLGLEQLYTAISPYAKTTLAYGENESDAVSNGTFNNFTSTINKGVSNTIGSSLSTSENRSHGSSVAGFTSSSGTSLSESYSQSDTYSEGTAKSTGSGTNSNQTRTTGTSKTLTKETTDKTAANILSYIDEQFERFKNYESFGAWETAAYFCAKKIEDSIVAANTFRALISGDETNAENSCVNVWDSTNTNTSAVAKYLRYCQHPRFVVKGSAYLHDQIVTPGNYISGKELPIFMSLPQKSVSGVTVTTMADFSRNVSHRGTVSEDARVIPLGCIHHMGKDEMHNKVQLDLDSFASHCFICGSTGSGKSNATYHLLQKFIRHQIPFLVIEPAKGEYKTAFGGVPGVHIYGTNPYLGAVLKVNPFEFHPSIHVLEHLDRLIEIFNACWEMYAAMPAILKNAIEKAYIRKGWDLQNSIYTKSGIPQFPTFADALDILPQVIRSSGYSADTQGDYTGALVTRVESLANGIAGQIFCDNYYVPDNILFDENTIVDLSRIGSTETKALIMGILVMRLNEYRMANAAGSNRELLHVTVLEEAHNLLKNVSQAQGQQSANPIGKSVEMICNSIAEMRTYGEGFIIVDQSPSSVDIAAIKNTNTKIAMRLPEQHDCEAIANSLSLNEAQTKELAKLPVGVAVVLQNNWQEPVLCKVSLADSERYKQEQPTNSFDQLKLFRGTILKALMIEYNITKTVDLPKMLDLIDAADLSSSTKAEVKGRLETLAEAVNQRGDAEYYYASLLYISGLRGLLAAAADELVGLESDKERLMQWENNILEQLRVLLTFPGEPVYSGLLRRCIFAMRWQNTKANYPMIYTTLYD